MNSWGATYHRSFNTGQRVIVHGMGNTLDGQYGSVVEWHNDEGAWRVRMEDGIALMLKTANLMKTNVPRATPESIREANRQELINGKRGGDNNDAETQKKARWEDRLEAQKNGLHQFLPGQQVRAKGLQNTPELNGQVGSVIELDFAASRWKVRFSDGLSRMLKTDNLEIAGLNRSKQSKPDWEKMGDFSQGQRVRVKGLQAKPELNGQAGSVLEPMNKDGRWKVRVDNGGPLKDAPIVLLKSDNLETGMGKGLASTAASPTFSTGQRVRVKGLVTKAEMNDLKGTIVGPEGDQRWEVQLDDNTLKVLHGINLESDEPDAPKASVSKGPTEPDTSGFFPGRRVTIFGLKSAPILNGKAGGIVEYDLPSKRWRVALKDGSSKLFKAENLEII